MATYSKSSDSGAPVSHEDAPHSSRWRKLSRRIAYGLLGILAILLIVFFLLPVWISNEQGRTYVLQQINQHMQAKIAVQNWSLGWFRGTELKDLTITLPDGTRLLYCPRVQTELTLWGILWGRYDLGNTRVETAQINLTKYADGTTSLRSFLPPDHPSNAPGFMKILRTLRGSLQVNSAVLTANSVSTGQSLTYTDVKAAVTIASPDTPFHVQISAVGNADGQGNEQNFSLNATFPALAAANPQPWSIFSDIEFSAVNLPTALSCDWAGADPRWEDSLGKVIERLRLSNHDTPPLETSRPILEIKGTDGAYIDARFLLHRALGNGVPATLSLPADSSYRAAAALRISPPLADLLRHVNPVFATLQRGAGLVNIALSDFSMNAGNDHDLQTTARVTFPPQLTLDRAGVLNELLKIGRDPASPQISPLTATAETLRLHIAQQNLTYDNFTMTFGQRQRVTFGGSVSLDGALNLMATVPAASTNAETLGSSTANVPLTGTVEKPLLRLPG